MTATAPATVSTRDARLGAGAMLGAATVWHWVPVHPPLACPLRTFTGIPCPLCGMTRSVVAGMHGHVVQSLRFNPGGLLVIVLAVVMLLGFRLERLRVSMWVWLGALGALWVWNIGFNPTFH